MSAQNKALILMIAVVAFVAGLMINSAQIEEINRADTLLSAKLQQAGSSDPVSIETELKELTLVNFWASWCAPCREEMPIFEVMRQQFSTKGFQVIGIAIDSPAKTKEMLDSMGITYPIYYAEQSGMLLMDSTGNSEGYLPYSILLDRNGEVLAQKVGAIDADDIGAWIEAYL